MKKNKLYKLRIVPWYLKMLGFSFATEVEVLSDPTIDEYGYNYACRVKSQTLYWLLIKIDKYEYKTRDTGPR